jgi:sugar/nucleoside kinase (ribokinase family)
MPPDLVLIGHLTHDLLADGTRRSGGTVLYAATTAQRLGVQAAVVSSGGAELAAELPPGVACVAAPNPQRPTFANQYSATGRTQLLHEAAPPLPLDVLPVAWRAAPMVLVAPVLQECDPAWVDQFPHALIAATPQGWMRRWDLPLPAPIHRVPWLPPPALLQRLDLIVVSEEDVAGEVAPVHAWAQHCKYVALTHGSAGATLFVQGVAHPIAAAPALERDPTGAGDVFATALLIGLHEAGDPLAAAHFAAAVAAHSVEGEGMRRIPTRAMLAARSA